MSQKLERAQLVIEWDREWVRVLFVDSGMVKEGSSLNVIEGIQGKTAAIMLSRRLVLHRSLALPDASRSDVLAALKQKLGEVFPIPAAELAFDYIPTIERNDQGRVCDVFAARKADVDSAIADCKTHNITVTQIVPAQAVSLRVAAQQLALSSGIVAERFGDWINIDAFKGGTLAASRVATLSSLPSDLGRLRAATGDAPTQYSYDVSLDGPTSQLSDPLIKAFTSAPFLIDLEPEEYRFERDEKARGRRHRALYLMGFVGLLGTYLLYDGYSSGVKKYETEKSRRARQIKTAEGPIAKLESDAAKLKPQGEALYYAFQPAQKTSDVLKIVSSLVPSGVWLTGVTFERGKVIQIRGTSTSADAVSTFVRGLTKQSRFRDVKLLFANSSDIEGIPTVQFSITAFPKGNVPILETGKKKK